ncbi:MAG: hypothetical protein JWO03_6 [Bacteroidetes bacterium]|nr:hypothetical protein [Bacteroidota bacterium]
MDILKKIFGVLCIVVGSLLVFAASIVSIKQLINIPVFNNSANRIGWLIGTFIGYAVIMFIGIGLCIFGAKKLKRKSVSPSDY